MNASVRVPVLTYHSFESSCPSALRTWTVSPKCFAAHLSYLGEAGYTGMSCTEFVGAVLAKNLPERPVVLTFDDGYENFASQALPLLVRYGFKGTIYITTGYVTTDHRVQRRYPTVLDWSQLLDIKSAGIEIGAHTNNHPPLDWIRPSAARREIREAKDILEQKLSEKVHSFAYPFGYFNSAVRTFVVEAGFTSACHIGYESANIRHLDEFAIPRHIVTELSPNAFRRLVENYTSPKIVALRLRSALWRIIRQRLPKKLVA